MEETLLHVISEIIAEKKKNNIVPDHALRSEVYEKVNASLQSLQEKGKINVGETINSKWITVNEK